MLDFNNPSDTLIPHGTVVAVEVRAYEGGAGEGGWLKRNRDGTCHMLDFEFVVLEGMYEGRKFRTSMVYEGETEGHRKAAEITKRRLCSMLESARGVHPSDGSESAVAARRVSSIADLNGLHIWVIVGIETGKGDYDDRNVLLKILTPQHLSWKRLEQPVQQIALDLKPTAAATLGTRPAWAGTVSRKD